MLMVASTSSIFAQKSKQTAPKNDSTTIAVYSCPMNPDVVSDKSGSCPKCGMDLTLSKKEQMKR